jgi:hypothetical protein
MLDHQALHLDDLFDSALDAFPALDRHGRGDEFDMSPVMLGISREARTPWSAKISTL